MPRTLSEQSPLFDSDEPLDSVLQRCPPKAFVTPAVNKPAALRPLKRAKTSSDCVTSAEADPPVLSLDDVPLEPRGVLSPRRLDMDQAVMLANPSVLVPSDDELEEEEVVQQTQTCPEANEDTEEGEISPSVPVFFMRCESASLTDA